VVLKHALAIQKEFHDAFQATADTFGSVQEKCTHALAASEAYTAQWEEEEQNRELQIEKTVEDSIYGTSNQMEGYLMAREGKKKASDRKYWVLGSGLLIQYEDWGSYERQAIFDLLLFTVKREGQKGFLLQSPKTNIHFETNTETKCSKWISVLEANISNKLDSAKETSTANNPQDERRKAEIMKELKDIEGNEECADCGASEPTWISLNFAILICHECSGVHRKLGTHISKVRSLTLDIIDEELFSFMKSIGNKKANSLLEFALDHKKPSGGSKREVREKFIEEKYQEKKWCPKTEKEPAVISATLFDSLVSDQVTELEMLKFLLLGADTKFLHAQTGQSLLHAVLCHSSLSLLLTQLLVFHDAVINVASTDTGETPLHSAVARDKLGCAKGSFFLLLFYSFFFSFFFLNFF